MVIIVHIPRTLESHCAAKKFFIYPPPTGKGLKNIPSAHTGSPAASALPKWSLLPDCIGGIIRQVMESLQLMMWKNMKVYLDACCLNRQGCSILQNLAFHDVACNNLTIRPLIPLFGVTDHRTEKLALPATKAQKR
jgi:hypothetical protein